MWPAIAVSCASAFYSALLVLAAYLVGSFSFSRGVGLAAGFVLHVMPAVSAPPAGGTGTTKRIVRAG